MKRRGAWSWVLKSFGVIVLLAVLLVVAGRFTVQSWPERAPGVRLEPGRPVVREADVTADNAYFHFRNLLQSPATSRWDAVPFARFNACGIEEGSATQLDAAVAAMAPALVCLRDAAACTNSQVPTVESFATLIPYVSPFLAAAKAQCVVAERAARAGDWGAAAAEYRVALRAADQVSRGGTVLHVLVNIAVSRFVCDSLRRVALEEAPPRDFLRAMDALLAELDAGQESFAECIRYEYLCWQNSLPEFYSAPLEMFSLGDGQARTDGGWKRVLAKPLLWLAGSSPERTLEHMAAACSQMILIADAERFPRQRLMSVMPMLRPDGILQTVGYLTDDGVGRILVSLLMPAMDNALERYFGQRAVFRGTRCVLAIRGYELERGRVPERLEDLVPGWLAALPEDPFAVVPAPMRYVMTDGEWKVYSLGPDAVDHRARYDGWSTLERAHHGDACDFVMGLDEPGRRCADYEKALRQPAVGLSCPARN